MIQTYFVDSRVAREQNLKRKQIWIRDCDFEELTSTGVEFFRFCGQTS